MIFVVVGTQEPFDRLIRAVDRWAGDTGYKEIFGQISRAEYLPTNFRYTDFIEPEHFIDRFRSADVIVGHAGMGTIIQALQFSKPIIVMPRLSSFHETRNDHQISTAKSFGRLGYVRDVYSEQDLFEALNRIDTIRPSKPIGPGASENLLASLREFIGI
ncbi:MULTISPECIES: glycosyltransferase [Lentimicrobium]|jgi:UDP-N-acetylglucosamine transferase subunit ALG13|uniref:UDP-N-acetylglucosamine transferase subunit ALG13 n=1 Tax=Lentimicrobium saccharophilum TaxID=1678841 RepID=A0A0S7C2G4_9BACT|nr:MULTISPECIES: glycosyltransferase [Lentimicrobium]MCO5255936.1 glycosyl transferase family 28 [Lentimicrobium sp.]GAP45047.1 UDP-N-acetylglucosamine transferase subunit ALG13 [Lentimicrobium saccharophilum]HPF63714.1 glycosyltransferase [Lentimicrobium sp.]HPJ61263.1 glycosyltransferase [Lentimicrobium sp.]HPR25050.1 glycosyltransferase [Lentimicrobium sp.]